MRNRLYLFLFSAMPSFFNLHSRNHILVQYTGNLSFGLLVTGNIDIESKQLCRAAYFLLYGREMGGRGQKNSIRPHKEKIFLQIARFWALGSNFFCMRPDFLHWNGFFIKLWAHRENVIQSAHFRRINLGEGRKPWAYRQKVLCSAHFRCKFKGYGQRGIGGRKWMHTITN